LAFQLQIINEYASRIIVLPAITVLSGHPIAQTWCKLHFTLYYLR